jgi:hypothetical protein
MRTPHPARAALLGALLGALALWTGPVVPAGAAPQKAAGGIRFTYTNPAAAVVAWAGAFNGWNTSANPMTKGADGTWSAVIPLPAGEHAYKFVVDGQWFADPENPVTAGEFGNSVVTVGADGGLVAKQATSNSPYSPKILMQGRTIAEFQDDWDGRTGRFAITRPTFDIDLGFDVRVSDVLRSRLLLNVNPERENVQDYRSRLNVKRGSIVMTQPGLELMAFDSENLPVWDDPFRLVGGIGPFERPFGYQRQGARLLLDRWGFDTEMQFSDNFDDRQQSDQGLYRDFTIDNFPTFLIGPQEQPRFAFESDPVGKALDYLRSQPSGAGFVLRPDQAGKVVSLDYGDNGRRFGFGDSNEDVFAARVRRAIPGDLALGLLGRTDRGFGFGRLVLAEPTGDSTATVTSALYSQQWYGGGVEAAWAPRPRMRVQAGLLLGARRMAFVNGSTRTRFHVGTIGATNTGWATAGDTIQSRRPTTVGADGDHLTTDRSARVALRGEWTFAQGDITVRSGVEVETHAYPLWTQAPVAAAGNAPSDLQRFETAEFQRGIVARPYDELDNRRTTWTLGWDRNWRYYLNREVRTSLDLDWHVFDYDARTAWQHQMWFPTGNFWLESGQPAVGIDRLTVLGETQVIRLRPRLEVPFWSRRDGRFEYAGTFSGVSLGRRPRYAETIIRLGLDLNRLVRLASDTRWVEYDAPALGLGNGYLSQFTEARLRFSPDIEVALGMGVDPVAFDPNLNEYARIGRDLFLMDRNASGFIAETDYLSLAPQIAAAEQRLQDLRRFQVRAVVHF